MAGKVVQSGCMIGKPALLVRQEGQTLVCTACRWYCRIPENFVGICSVRANVNGKLMLLVHGKVASYHADPIEKKPLYHFLPGSQIFSLGTFGCNFGCEFCQNWEISQTPKQVKAEALKKESSPVATQKIIEFIKQNSQTLPPEKIVEICLTRHIPSIAFTYNEPAIFAEYAADTMRLAKKHHLFGVFVSSGFESKEAMALLDPYIDAYNIDLKGATEEFYQKVCHTRLAPVLETITEVYRRGKWLEITTLLIPGLNTDEKDIRWIARFIAELSRDIPWHVTAFYPQYKMMDLPPTNLETLKYAYEIGKEEGLRFVYCGNIPDRSTESTFCPSCKTLLIERFGFLSRIKNFDPKTGRCGHCQEKIPGVWKQ